jgi:hypothetical protein
LIRARNFRLALTGGQTQPAVFECDDDREWVLKLMGNPHLGTVALCADWVGTCLAKLADVPVLDCDLVDVDEQALSTLPAESPMRSWTRPGPAFGTIWLEEAFVPPGMESILSAASAVAELARIMVIDTWLDVLDRKKGPLQWNLLRGTGEDSSLVVIDFGLALTEILSGFVLGSPMLTVRCPDEWRPHVHISDVRNALRKVLEIPPNDIAIVVASIPLAWRNEVPGCSRIPDYLEMRRTQLSRVFEEWFK